jgi:hypothetical protein
VIWPADVTLMRSRQPDAKLLGDQHGESGADRATHDAVFVPVMLKNVQLGVVAGPARMKAGASGSAQVPHDVAVRIENADIRNGDVGEPLLPSRFAQQAFGRESRWRFITFVPKNRRSLCFTHRRCSRWLRWPTIWVGVAVGSSLAPFVHGDGDHGARSEGEDTAVAQLRLRGFNARRPEDGLPEWCAAGLPVIARNG